MHIESIASGWVAGRSFGSFLRGSTIASILSSSLRRAWLPLLFHVVLRPERSNLCPVHVILRRVAGLGSEPQFVHRSNRSDLARFGIEEESSTPVQVQWRTTVGLYRC